MNIDHVGTIDLSNATGTKARRNVRRIDIAWHQFDFSQTWCSWENVVANADYETCHASDQLRWHVARELDALLSGVGWIGLQLNGLSLRGCHLHHEYKCPVLGVNEPTEISLTVGLCLRQGAA